MDDLKVPELTAYCGLNCGTCQIYVATRETDGKTQKAMREEIAGICRSRYGMDLTLNEIGDCDGCRSDTGRLFSGCAKCGIRACARGKGIDNCAFCPDYICEMLRQFKLIEDARGMEPGYYGEGA